MSIEISGTHNDKRSLKNLTFIGHTEFKLSSVKCITYLMSLYVLMAEQGQREIVNGEKIGKQGKGSCGESWPLMSFQDTAHSKQKIIFNLLYT